MPPIVERRLAAIPLVLGGLIMLVFVGLVLRYDHDLRGAIRQKMIERDAAVLTSVAQQEIETGSPIGSDPNSARWLSALLPGAHRQGLLAMAIFDADGVTLERVPATQFPVELPADDLVQLQNGQPLTRYWPRFSLGQLFPGNFPEATPVLEIVLPLHRRAGSDAADAGLIGFVRYHLDARVLAHELATLDDNVRRQTILTLALGLSAFVLIVAVAYVVLYRAQKTIAERTGKLQRANFDLALTAKASALGQITSHLVHGLQGSVAGLRALVLGHNTAASSDWDAAAKYAEHMQAMIQETVNLLGDNAGAASYELTGHELADIILRRNAPAAKNKGVVFKVSGGFDQCLNSHHGGLLCLIANNLVQNAVEATDAGMEVTVTINHPENCVTLLVTDAGHGIPAEMRAHLFEPGFSGRLGGTGLGLSISQLLAKQIGATLTLDATGPNGTSFRVTQSLKLS
ncbi:MAG TPA: ATP-binding protein [Lacunisphaera sp.]|jgi:signal transduction histidine kinase